MEFISKDLLHYCESLSDKESDLLKRLNRETFLKVNSPRMLSGHLQGRFLSLLSKLLNPKYILEIGTYTGYSALCLAEGLAPGGKLITIDPNEETNIFAQRYFNQSEYSSQIELIQGQASDVIPKLEFEFDIVFIDADKRNYSLYYDGVFDKLRSGGLIIVDNVLWSGKVLDAKKDTDTILINEFNEKISKDTRVSKLVLPIRDGLTIITKKPETSS